MDGSLDGSAERLHRYLQELVEMTGQTDSTHAAPVLTLLLGDICTSTALSTIGAAPCLSITAILPRAKRSEYQPLSTMPSTMSEAFAREYEFMWHADEGKYVVVRNVPITALVNERCVLDAILEASDQAVKWFASVCIGSNM